VTLRAAENRSVATSNGFETAALDRVSGLCWGRLQNHPLGERYVRRWRWASYMLKGFQTVAIHLTPGEPGLLLFAATSKCIWIGCSRNCFRFC